MRLVAPFLDRQGSPISFKKFCSLHSDPNYVLVGYTAGEGWQVMTTWTGLGLVDEPWETSHLFQLVALHDSGGAVAWFASEADALDGHRLCAQYFLNDLADDELHVVKDRIDGFVESLQGQ